MYRSIEQLPEIIAEANNPERTESVIEQLTEYQGEIVRHLQFANKLEYLAQCNPDSVAGIESNDDRHNRLSEFLSGVGILITNQIDELRDKQRMISN